MVIIYSVVLSYIEHVLWANAPPLAYARLKLVHTHTHTHTHTQSRYSAQYYVKVMQKVQDRGEEYVAKETERLGRVLSE